MKHSLSSVLSSVLTLVSPAAAYAQDAGSGIAEAGIFKLAVPFIGEVPVPEEFKYPILIAVTVVLLLFYGPRVLSALRVITTRVTPRESLEEERIKLEILKTRYEIEYFKTTHKITLTETNEAQPILDAVAVKANAAAERLEIQQQLVRTQLENPDKRSRFVFRRITALLIDYLLIAFAGGFVLAMLSIVLPPIPPGTWQGGDPYGLMGQIIFNILIIAAYVVYFVAMWMARGATLGKMIVGLKIVSVDGQAITFTDALIRFVLLAAVGASIGFLWLLFDPQKQSLHDKAGRTVVVKIRERFEFL
jgi:uncharacterized RDD family membrane protein YckC